MQLTILIFTIINTVLILITLGVASYALSRITAYGNDDFEILNVVIGLRGMIRKLGNFVENEYQRAASANGMFREQAAEAKATLANHMAGCHADDPKPEDTPAFTELINEEATHKLAEFFEAAGIKPDEASKSLDLIEGEVTKIVTNSTGEITEVNGLPVLIAESGPEDIYPDEELPFEDEEDDSCPRDEHRYKGSIFCTECGADGIAAGDIDPDDEDKVTVEHPTRGYEDVELPDVHPFDAADSSQPNSDVFPEQVRP